MTSSNLNIKAIYSIFEKTPIEQPLMLVGIHGIGKSEIVKDHFSNLGYKVITLFLGQLSDAGDLIGLPDRTEVIFKYNGNETKQKITEFCPPKWFPHNEDDKIILFLDEFNRGKPEIYQCVMDMVLNRKINGLDLPKNTRIIAAMNPPGDEYDYDIQDLDPALFDRFNVYKFEPDYDEWIDWLVKNKANKYVINFAYKSKQNIDPPIANQRKNGEVYPSRRSWKRVSDILNINEDLLKDYDMLYKIVSGIVGFVATSQFVHYLKEAKNQVSAGAIITNWSTKIEQKVRTLSPQEIIYLNKEMDLYLREQCKLLFDGSPSSLKYAINIEKYLKCLQPELVGSFFDYMSNSNNCEDEDKKWGSKLFEVNHNLSSWWLDVVRGKTEEDKQLERNIAGEGIDDDDLPRSLQDEIDDLLS